MNAVLEVGAQALPGPLPQTLDGLIALVKAHGLMPVYRGMWDEWQAAERFAFFHEEQARDSAPGQDVRHWHAASLQWSTACMWRRLDLALVDWAQAEGLT